MQEDTTSELLGDSQAGLSFSTDNFVMPEQLVSWFHFARKLLVLSLLL